MIPDVIVPEFHDAADETIRWMHRSTPIYRYDPRPRYSEAMWIVSKWSDVRDIERNAEDFVNRLGISLRYSFDDQAGDSRFKTAMTMPGSTDPPVHTRLRRLANASLSPRRVRSLERRIYEAAARALDEIQPGSVADFASIIAKEIPARVMCDLLGLSYDRAEDLRTWDNVFSRSLEPGNIANVEAMTDLLSFLQAAVSERRCTPQDDMISDLIQAQRDGDHLTEDEILLWARTILLAGIGTTSGLLAGGVRALLDHPEQKDILLTRPDAIDGAVNEMLRWTTPLRYQMRTAVRRTEIGDAKIEIGDKIFLWYLAANRDPEVFHRPYEFHVLRVNSNDHLAYGYGVHRCIGALLASLEGRIVIRELLSRFPNIEWAGEYRPDSRTKLNLASHMPIRFNP